MNDVVVGIDLGTTNSEVAGFKDGKVRILGSGQGHMLPSCVGLAPTGELLIGQAARNQQLLYPDQTIRSIKRKMGFHEPIKLGEKTYAPPDISALILRELASRARHGLDVEVSKAVITVPAYFSDAQRQATREAGALAGLEVVRLINEPTAASLAYGYGAQANRTVMVYDLGGGTFDVSIVEIQDQVTQVLASHGNTHLGGDDFDQLFVNHLLKLFHEQHEIDLKEPEYRGALIRLCIAAEEAKKRLSFTPFTKVREEALIETDGKPLHMDVEISQSEYEQMIRPLVESTMESVSKALADASKSPDDIDVVLLVGGATRTPLVSEVLEQRMGAVPRQDVHPDLCVALGAGLLGSRIAGHEIEKVLVDVSPYSFGISHLGEKDGFPYRYCYKPIIQRNTPLPVTRTDLFCTAVKYQTAVEIEIFQGDDPDAMNNTPVGNFRVTGLASVSDLNEVLCRMRLDLDGILRVSAIEKKTGLSKQVAISGALQVRTDAELETDRHRLEQLFANRESEDDMDLEEQIIEQGATLETVGQAEIDPDDPSSNHQDPELVTAIEEGRALVARCRSLIGKLHADDRVEAVDLNEEVEVAISKSDMLVLNKANDALREFLFFVEGK